MSALRMTGVFVIGLLISAAFAESGWSAPLFFFIIGVLTGYFIIYVGSP